jgi:hypothetical protein
MEGSSQRSFFVRHFVRCDQQRERPTTHATATVPPPTGSQPHLPPFEPALTVRVSAIQYKVLTSAAVPFLGICLIPRLQARSPMDWLISCDDHMHTYVPA